MKDPLHAIWKKDGRFAYEAYQFLYDALDHAVRLSGKDKAEVDQRHVTGQELLEGMRARAMELYGPLAAHVWRSWGIQTTKDWGRIVFLLIDEGMMNRQETDSLEDFADVYDLEQAFVESYQPTLPPTIEPNVGS
ncbi:MAG: hypothetical protein H6830_03625 [Planctomycetes bacterium]|nr:hypothetical protein [Planctomycetota bacterium]HPF15059.1 hypothetical protein [Planctomycetota bacterium]